MPQCHVQVKTPNFFSVKLLQNKKDLVSFCETPPGNCNNTGRIKPDIFVSFAGGPWQRTEGKLKFVNFVSFGEVWQRGEGK